MKSVSIITTSLIGISKAAIGGIDTSIEKMNDWDGVIEMDSKGICGCSIITYEWILTAAHCVFEVELWQLKISIGEHYLPSTQSAQQPKNGRVKQGMKVDKSRKIIISKKIIHPKYSDESPILNDSIYLYLSFLVALLKFYYQYKSNHNLSLYNLFDPKSYEIHKPKPVKTQVWLNANPHSNHLKTGSILESQGFGALFPYLGFAARRKQSLSIIVRDINECKRRQLKEVDINGNLCVNGFLFYGTLL